MAGWRSAWKRPAKGLATTAMQAARRRGSGGGGPKSWAISSTVTIVFLSLKSGMGDLRLGSCRSREGAGGARLARKEEGGGGDEAAGAHGFGGGEAAVKRAGDLGGARGPTAVVTRRGPRSVSCWRELAGARVTAG